LIRSGVSAAMPAAAAIVSAVLNPIRERDLV
jgi:hypothetical protein